MAGSSLLTLLDDIATLLDDIAAMTKVSAQKTAGVLGDDLAVNAQQVAGVTADRELPVVWAVAKGSFRNKAILVPAALTISYFTPWAVTPLLMLGGAYLCYEGFEKLAHRQPPPAAGAPAAAAAVPVDVVAYEKEKVTGAIRTDFVLSAEIITITLGLVAGAAFGVQIAVLTLIAIVMTFGVYGVVAGIVKLDDLGLYLSRRPGATFWDTVQRRLGATLVPAAPFLMKVLSVAGTAAMFLVGGGILAHGLPGTPELFHHWAAATRAVPVIGGWTPHVVPLLLNTLAGVVAGAAVWAGLTLARRGRRPRRPFP